MIFANLFPTIKKTQKKSAKYKDFGAILTAYEICREYLHIVKWLVFYSTMSIIRHLTDDIFVYNGHKKC